MVIHRLFLLLVPIYIPDGNIENIWHRGVFRDLFLVAFS